MVNLSAWDKREMRAVARAFGFDLRTAIRHAVIGYKYELESKARLARQLGLHPIALCELVRADNRN